MVDLASMTGPLRVIAVTSRSLRLVRYGRTRTFLNAIQVRRIPLLSICPAGKVGTNHLSIKGRGIGNVRSGKDERNIRRHWMEVFDRGAEHIPVNDLLLRLERVIKTEYDLEPLCELLGHDLALPLEFRVRRVAGVWHNETRVDDVALLPSRK